MRSDTEVGSIGKRDFTTGRRWTGKHLHAVSIAVFLSALAGVSHALPDDPSAPIDRQVDDAVRRGVDYLLKRPHPGGKWSGKFASRYPGEVESLVCLAVLSCDEQAGPKRISDALSYLGQTEPSTVYARALRAMVYARLPRETYGERLDADVEWLIAQERNGGWGYGPGHPTTGIRADWLDNRNSQVALLALADASAAGSPVSDTIWASCAAYWSGGQNSDGGWGFEPSGRSPSPLRPASYGSMTATGVASLYLLAGAPPTEPATQPDEPRKPAPSPHRKAIAAGLKWLEDRYSSEAVPGWIYGEGDEWLYYYLYCLGRALNATGVRTFAGRDWCEDMARGVVSNQQPDGSWRYGPAQPVPDFR